MNYQPLDDALLALQSLEADWQFDVRYYQPVIVCISALVQYKRRLEMEAEVKASASATGEK